MCFEQAGPWQQKSCAMLKQWQRYGAGITQCAGAIFNLDQKFQIQNYIS